MTARPQQHESLLGDAMPPAGESLTGFDWNEVGIDTSDWRWSFERIDPDRIKTWIYFIEEGSAEKPIKIGIAKNVKSRRQTLQTGNSNALTVVGKFRGTKGDEARLHRMFAESRIIRQDHSEGEWFERTPELLAAIDELTTRRTPAK